MPNIGNNGAQHQDVSLQNLQEVAKISYFRGPIINVTPWCILNMEELAFVIANDQKLKETTDHYRALPDGAERKAFKLRCFDNATFSGVFTKRNSSSLDTYSGLMVLDLDHLQDVAEIREALINQNAIDVVMMYVSPSGNGLKVVVPATTEDEHEQVFGMYERFLKHEMGIIVDSSGRDLSRTSFVCSDPNIYLNLNYKYSKLEGYWEPPVTSPTLVQNNSSQRLYNLSNFAYSPIRDFNVRGDIDALLLDHGWSVYRKQSNKTHYTRPGKHSCEGPSGNVLHSINYFYVFTSSTVFPSNQGYRAAEVFAILKCGGDMLLASKQLRAMGYGDQGDEEVVEHEF